MGKQILIYKLQGDIEKWNNEIEKRVGKDNYTDIRRAILDGPVANIENMPVYKFSMSGDDMVNIIIEEIE